MTISIASINNLLADDEIVEIMIDGWQRIYMDKKGQLVDMPSPFANEAELLALVQEIVTPLGLRADETNPMVDTRLEDGTRVNIVMPPVAVNGPIVSLRRPIRRDFSAEDLVRWGSIGQEMNDFLRLCVIGRLNICIAGGTASGKTTILHILCSTISAEERILVLPSGDEFVLPQPRVVTLEPRPADMDGKGEITPRDLVQNAVRMRPDRIILVEVLGAELLDLLNAMNNGHDGTLFTIHASSIQDALNRMEILAGTGNPPAPLLGLREQIASAVQVICYLKRMMDGTRRMVKIAEVTGVNDGVITTHDLFEFRRTGVKEGKIQGIYSATGVIPTFLHTLREAGLDMPISMFTQA